MPVIENLIQIGEVVAVSVPVGLSIVCLYAVVEDRITRPAREQHKRDVEACIARENSPEAKAREKMSQELGRSIDDNLREIHKLATWYCITSKKPGELDSEKKTLIDKVHRIASQYIRRLPTSGL